MDAKIALEEHFAIQETLGDSIPYAAGAGWSGARAAVARSRASLRSPSSP
jgi:hypothetical protein